MPTVYEYYLANLAKGEEDEFGSVVNRALLPLIDPDDIGGGL
jgi:hypothetical protein